MRYTYKEHALVGLLSRGKSYACDMLQESVHYPDHFFPFFLHYFFTSLIWAVVTVVCTLAEYQFDQEIINVGSGILGFQKKKIFWVYV